MKRYLVVFLTLILAAMTVLSGCTKDKEKAVNNTNTVGDTNTVSETGTGDDVSTKDAEEAASSSVKAGTYTASAKGIGEVTITLTVDADGVITDLSADASNETTDIGGEAVKKLVSQILERQTVAVDAVSGATYSSSAVITAVTDALKQAGVDPEKMEAKDIPAGVDEEVTVDVAVVGAGTSGTGAALAASEKGAKVMIIEKTSKVGGMGTTGLGLFATESSLQAKAGVTVTSKEMFEYLEKYNHYRSNGALLKAIIDKSGDTVDWLIANGIGLHMGLGVNQKAHINGPKTYHMWDSSVEDFPKVYEKMQNEYGAELRLNTKAVELIKTEDGTVAGVIAEKEDGGKLTVNAKAVILCTGGFGADEEMMKEYTQISEYNYFGYGNTGEGVKMAWDAGADQLGNHVLQIHLGDLPGSKTINDRYGDNAVTQVKDVPLLWVNKEGTRFVNESVVYDNVLWGNATYSAGGEYYAIVDQASVDKFIKDGIAMTGAYQMNGSGLMAPEGGNDTDITIAPLANLQQDLETLINEKIVFKGETLEELAQASGMNAEKLKENVTMYNNAVKSGDDDHFYKDAQYLLYSVEKGPFYAVRVRGSVYGSIGGVRINEDIQAITESGQPISGLYVAGADAGGLYDNTYPDIEGVTMAFAMNSGRIAGENAADDAKK